jgi:hypothetical protein
MYALIVAAGLFMTQQPPSPAPPHPVHGVEHSYFTGMLKRYEKRLVIVDDPKYYKSLRFKNAKTGKVRTIDDLSPVERKVIFIMTMAKLEDEILEMIVDWKSAADHQAAIEKSGIEPFELTKPVSSSEIKSYINTLNALRPFIAAKHEEMVENLYRDHADVFTKQEAEYHLKILRERHDLEKILERRK